MLNTSYEENNNIKTIIFVKDRSVAVYLKKLLAGDDSPKKRDIAATGVNEDSPANGD